MQDEQPGTTRVNLTFTTEQLRRIKAASSGMPVATWCRFAALQKLDRLEANKANVPARLEDSPGS